MLNSFDPFNNRLCRKIRNGLSESLMQSISDRDTGAVEIQAERFLEETAAEKVIAEYILDRQRRYREILDQIQTAGIQDDQIFQIACLLWNQGLFFEVHEWLEKKWLKSQGTEKKVCQALIRAAGVYVKLESGRTEGAEKLAEKAVQGLRECGRFFPDEIQVDRLIEKLLKLDPQPPLFDVPKMLRKQQ